MRSENTGKDSINPVSANNPQVLDLNYLTQACGGDTIFVKELLELFVADTQTRLQQAQAAARSSDLKRLENIMHHIQGASANVGAKAVQTLAAQLEQQAEVGNLENAVSLLAQLEEAYDAVTALVATSTL
jgi:HPt (histidine-containing phosphotransfer) domain-containing protein